MAIELTFNLSDKEREAISNGLDAHNKQAAPLDEVEPLCVIARDGEAPAGGAIGRTWGECCELLNLWVAEEHRRQGIGTELMRAFEATARDRGCATIYLDTFTFQAPAFYDSLGFVVVAKMSGFGHGIERFIYTKSLTASSS